MLHKVNGTYILSRTAMDRDVRSPLLIGAAVLMTAAALLSVPGFLRLFDPVVNGEFFKQLRIEQVDTASHQAWYFLHCFVYTVGLIGPLLLTVGLWITVLSSLSRRKDTLPAAGPSYFIFLARLYHIFSWVTAIGLAGLFLFRALRYILANAFEIGGFLFIFAMLMPELIFAAVVTIVVVPAVRWTKQAVHTAENIRLIFLSGEPVSYSMAGSTTVMLVLLGVAAAAIAVLHWGEAIPMLAFGCTAAGDILTGIWLRRYKSKIEQRAYAAQRMLEGKPVNIKL